MRAPVGVLRRRGIGRPADGGQVRAIRTLRVGNASRCSLVGMNHLVSPVLSQRPVSLDATDPDSRTCRHSGQAKGTEFQRNGERNGNPPSPFGCKTRERSVYRLLRSAKFLLPCVIFVRKVIKFDPRSCSLLTPYNRKDLSRIRFSVVGVYPGIPKNFSSTVERFFFSG